MWAVNAGEEDQLFAWSMHSEPLMLFTYVKGHTVVLYFPYEITDSLLAQVKQRGTAKYNDEFWSIDLDSSAAPSLSFPDYRTVQAFSGTYVDKTTRTVRPLMWTTQPVRAAVRAST